jgi:transposase
MYGVDMYLAVRQYVLVEGHTRKEAARAFGLNHNTVQKMCTYPSPPGYRRSRPHERRRLGRFTEIIEAILRDDQLAPPKQRHTIRRIVARLRDEHGYDGAYSTVVKYVAKAKPRLRNAFIPLSHLPGHAQIDFGRSEAIIGGVQQKVYLFCFIFAYSDAPFIKAYPTEGMASFLDGHVSAFHFFGKVPSTILYDNTPLAVSRLTPDGTRKRTKDFSEFISHYLFKDRYCRVGRGNDKSKVEKLVRFGRRNFMTPMPVVEGYQALNAKLEADCTRRLQGKVRHASERIGERLVLDLKSSRPLPAQDLAVFESRRVRVSKSSLAPFKANEYSVPSTHIGSEVVVKAGVDEVVIFSGDELIARHPRLYGREKVAYEPLHYLALLEERPGALDQAAPLRGWSLPPIFARVRTALETKMGDAGKREYIRVLRLLETFEMSHAVAGIKAAMKLGLVSSDAIKSFVVAQLERRPVHAGTLRRLRASESGSNQRRSASRHRCSGVGAD